MSDMREAISAAIDQRIKMNELRANNEQLREAVRELRGALRECLAVAESTEMQDEPGVPAEDQSALEAARAKGRAALVRTEASIRCT